MEHISDPAHSVQQFAALGHPLRLQILGALRERPASGPDLARLFGRPKSTVGYHVRILEQAGLIVVVLTRRVRAMTEHVYGLAPTAAGFDDASIPAAERDLSPPAGPQPRQRRRRPTVELASTAQAGVLRFIHYGYMPNRLGYCGPQQDQRLFEHGVAGEVDGSLVPQLGRFLGPLPYLRAIAAGSGIGDIFDDRVVEAYWIGNSLLERFEVRQLHDDIREKFRRQLPARIMDLISEKIPAGALPHHSFHVFDVWLRVGRLRSNVVGTLDECRISIGTVVSVEGATVGVDRRRLVLSDGKLMLGAHEKVYATRLVDGRGFVADVAPGDLVSLHWGWVCERLTDAQAQALDRYTRRHIGIANQTI